MENKNPVDYINTLAHKWRSGQISQQEMQELNTWYEQHQDEFVELPGEYKDQPDLIKDRIEKQVFDRINRGKPESWKKNNLGSKIAVAASIILIAAAGLFYNKYNRRQEPATGNYSKTIVPGKQGATLMLANGKKIRLSDAGNGELAKESGVSISKTANGQITYEIKQPLDAANQEEQVNTLSTEKGETYGIKLPDGSLVILNAASSITYAANITALHERRVKLRGEAYFEVAKDKIHPFIVETEQQQVAVLGTHFNVMAYEDEETVKTTLLEGAVKISAHGKYQSLKPGQQAEVKPSGIQLLDNVDLEEITAWKNGDFKFNDNLENIMSKIARWYNVEIIYQNKFAPDLTFSGKISRSRNISCILKMLEYNGDVHFKIEGRKIIVTK
ncbi:FecR family protein [Pedobacter sp.]|jgi:transmembrane sensor|uniref:FecR family protein n=1 Tax=Pedobacter sp. TaxID=1411316 RepID=UPI002BA5C735|nr:FecR domain-containing protein [Pedobacter sp.]HWW42499.1 FecR domain-containing protein [Pedobacter sp.]